MSQNPKQEPIDDLSNQQNSLNTGIITGLDSATSNSFLIPQSSMMLQSGFPLFTGRNSFDDISGLNRQSSNLSFSGLPTSVLPYVTDSNNPENILISPRNSDMPRLDTSILPPNTTETTNNNNKDTKLNIQPSLAGQFNPNSQLNMLDPNSQLFLQDFNLNNMNVNSMGPPMIGHIGVVPNYSPENITRKRRRRRQDFSDIETNQVKGNAQTGYRMLLEEPGHKDMLSCHQCKNKKKINDVIICGHVFMVKNIMKTCTKKYCNSCLLRFYLESPITNCNDPSWPLWKCPCCRFICSCAWCRKKKAKRMSAAASAIRGNAHRLTPSTSLARKLVTETGLENENDGTNNIQSNTSHLLPPPIPQELLDTVKDMDTKPNQNDKDQDEQSSNKENNDIEMEQPKLEKNQLQLPPNPVGDLTSSKEQ